MEVGTEIGNASDAGNGRVRLQSWAKAAARTLRAR